MANNYMKRCSTLFVIREIQTKGPKSGGLTPNDGQDHSCGTTGSLTDFWWECRRGQPLQRKHLIYSYLGIQHFCSWYLPKEAENMSTQKPTQRCL